ncbi:hypothetical protein [Riemerella anatipestifer]|uniref:Uncharacterized protein n=2 Tax=Riemerella anatipestifer TaxID=34085 RepID=J9R8A2_RIEAN|nr:hypothetical protein [Riemerella anatipestifer]AFR36668.1 hypothetical protein B739_2086 [Riemerella anatipestifer RA-CH-1]AIH01468.1 peptidase s41 [Riemerella anatipestifer CH3]AQY23154.1 hypothetical protein AB406_2218 [Riemerella anatipestifer]MBT0552445.1 hypothetical protein [Riemerella anatipestifer]MBT0554682.1 hypothetical protein [Riemerella anatipestifer]
MKKKFEFQPDVKVYLDQEKANQGKDNQLKRAVEELRKDLNKASRLANIKF